MQIDQVIREKKLKQGQEDGGQGQKKATDSASEDDTFMTTKELKEK